jgi:hypothetical protein
MPLTVETFLVRFPQFDKMKNGDEKIGAALASAYSRCGEAFGALQDEAAGYLAAHMIATNPANENMAMVKGLPGTSIYYVEYLRLVEAARPLGTTSGPTTPPIPSE